MKKSFLTFAIGVLTLGLSFGQDQGDARFYGFGSYGLRSNNWGLGGGIEFFFADNFALMPSYTRYNPEVGNQSNLSMDLRYYLSQGPSQVYLMAGYSQTFQNTQPGSPGTKQNFVGANMGVGAFVRLTDWVGILSEFKYQSQYFQESSFKLGLGFPL
jgi:hypothetical protein